MIGPLDRAAVSHGPSEHGDVSEFFRFAQCEIGLGASLRDCAL